MADYNNRGGGSRPHSGGRPSFGGRSTRPSFGKKSWGNDRSGGAPITLHKATCAECGKTCEVPFRPVGGKPIYCKECFEKRGGNVGRERGGERGGERFPGREFRSQDRGSSSHSSHSGVANSEMERGHVELRKQLESANAKLERLIQAVEMLKVAKSRL